MAFTAEDQTRIEAAIASGTLRVRFADGREVTYQSAADLMAVRSLIRDEILASAATPEPRYTRVVTVRA